MRNTRTCWLPAARSSSWFQLTRHDDPEPVVPPAPAPAADKDPAADPSADPDKDPEGADQLGDAGKRALSTMRAEKAAAKKEAAEAKRQAEEAQAKVREYEDRDKSELEKANEAAEQAQTRAEAATKRAVTAEVKAAAAEFADVDDAVAFLDLTSYANPDGEIDTAAIATDLAGLLERKPHLRKQTAAPAPPAPKPDPGQGPRPPAPPADYRSASKDDFEAALAKLGVAPRR
ncbi:hypothetical protein OOK29_26050 [Streptomyces phaeochromogenes]|uniref:hypothetical protein n=1 Tax=Streptomyces phaeochromogenes TaxID=1923 RepID=UPI0022585EC5|nr:hypothetical protein [Streptomyces phaeochromogenes]MCX5601618.1 hypothetical protein [Streptomyces phaeochromogenes]